MIKLLSLIASLSLTTSAVLPISEVAIETIKENQETKVDLSTLNGYSETQQLGYFLFDLEYYKSGVATTSIQRILMKEQNISIQTNWIQVEFMINVMDGREANDDDISGKNGASKETWLLKIVPTELGLMNNVVGEAYVYSTIHHHPGDLNTYNNFEWLVEVSKEAENDLEFVWFFTTTIISYRISARSRYNALYFATEGIDHSPFYVFDEELNIYRLATQEDIDKAIANNESLNFTLFSTRNQAGINKGIYGSARMNVRINFR
ncbi:hypothetical protein [Spiroplasma monobiae]|uniref:Uncharacterized protein n=1 Tax=Spiroplasma monobiae MQ-1 TaxID=1336748 RepID=A0A2K9LUP8_SPISQ|nr:hypothetical protein [Spiroplasma monobiae]AUM62750.1 hypothetical protein SMONO_v1c05010 [Spiroplasma monobiae MQ-1]